MTTKMKMTICLKMTIILPRPLDGKHVTPLPLQYILNGYRPLLMKLFELIVNESILYNIQRNPAKPLKLIVQELEQLFGTQ